MKKMVKSTIFCYLIILSITTIVWADHNQYVFEQANQLYQQEKYQQAINKYNEIAKNGYTSWQLDYNLGNAYYKSAQFGQAILYYERALKLNPKHEDILFNLHLVNLKIVDNIVVPPQFILTMFFSEIKNIWGIETLLWLTVSFYLVFTILVVLNILVRKHSIQRLVKVVIIPLAVVLIIITVIFSVRIHEDNTVHYAILLTDKVDVLGSPTYDGTELFSLHEGVKFKVEQLSGEWAKIRLADGNVGWVKRDVFEII